MHRIQSILYLICLPLILGILPASCTRSLDLEPLSEPMLAMDAWWWSGRELSLKLSNTVPFNDQEGSIRFMHEAKVDVFENGGLLGTMIADSTYSNPENEFILPGTYLNPGSTYRVEASAPGFPPVHAEMAVPELPNLSAIRFIERELIDTGLGDSLYPEQRCLNTIEIDIVDGPGVEYYVLGWAGLKSFEGGRQMGSDYSNVIVLDSLLEDEVGLIHDKPFANRTQTIRLQVKSHWWTNDAKIYMRLYSVPYEYVLLAGEQTISLTQDNPFVEPFGQFSNVIGGTGTLMCFPLATDSIIVQP